MINNLNAYVHKAAQSSVFATGAPDTRYCTAHNKPAFLYIHQFLHFKCMLLNHQQSDLNYMKYYPIFYHFKVSFLHNHLMTTTSRRKTMRVTALSYKMPVMPSLSAKSKSTK